MSVFGKSLIWLACFVAVEAVLWVLSPWLAGAAFAAMLGGTIALSEKFGHERDSPELLEFDAEHDSAGNSQTGAMLWLSWAAEAVFDTPCYWLHRVGL